MTVERQGTARDPEGGLAHILRNWKWR